MPGRGGARPGAGRKPSLPQHYQQAQPAIMAIRDRIAKGELPDPLEALIRFAANKKLHPAQRIAAAGLATRYIHPLLSAIAVEHTSRIGVSDRQAQVHSLLDRLNRILPADQKTITQDVHNFASAATRVPTLYKAQAIVARETIGTSHERDN
jgi:hypothetical protein